MFKGKFKKWLERLAESNEAEFGKDHKLECCELNREEHTVHTKNEAKKHN